MLSNQQCFSEENVQTLSEQRVCYLFSQKLKIWNWNICRRFLGYLLQGLGSGCRIGGFENQLKGLTIPTGLTCQDFQTCLFTRIHRSEAFFKVNTRECSESFEDVKKHKIYQNEYVLSSSLLDFVLLRKTAYIRVQRKCAIFILSYFGRCLYVRL